MRPRHGCPHQTGRARLRCGVPGAVAPRPRSFACRRDHGQRDGATRTRHTGTRRITGRTNSTAPDAAAYMGPSQSPTPARALDHEARSSTRRPSSQPVTTRGCARPINAANDRSRPGAPAAGIWGSLQPASWGWKAGRPLTGDTARSGASATPAIPAVTTRRRRRTHGCGPRPVRSTGWTGPCVAVMQPLPSLWGGQPGHERGLTGQQARA